MKKTMKQLLDEIFNQLDPEFLKKEFDEIEKEKVISPNAFDVIKTQSKVPIKRGCPNSPGRCFCTGVCQEIIGWRDKITGEL